MQDRRADKLFAQMRWRCAQGGLYKVPQQSPFASASPHGRMRTLSAPEQREGSPSQNGASACHPFSRCCPFPPRIEIHGKPGCLLAEISWNRASPRLWEQHMHRTDTLRADFFLTKESIAALDSLRWDVRCSMESLEEAPTEAGFHLDGHIEKVLSELGDDGQQLRRYSRSFSEPNLAMHFLQAVRGPSPYWHPQLCQDGRLAALRALLAGSCRA